MAVNADPQDGIDAAHRARSGYRGEWHPVLSLTEPEPGTFHLVDWAGTPVAVLRLVTVGGELGWRAVSYHPESARRRLIAYTRTQRGAAELAWKRYLASLGPGGPPRAG